VEVINFNGVELTEVRIIRLLDERLAAARTHRSSQQARQRAAVLVPLLQVDGAWHLLFTRRTDTVLTHKGQVAFPGGAVEPEDPNVVHTALREAYEEIGLIPDQVKILGQMPDYVTVSQYAITPIIGYVFWPFEMILSADEVTRAFTIPLAWLANKANYEERLYTRSDGRQEMLIFYQTYSGELLWGITARITIDFLAILGLS
jgi:8-oxo-dGTP pyrophosphatase MutT (NUDIX family)